MKAEILLQTFIAQGDLKSVGEKAERDSKVLYNIKNF